MSTQSDRRGRRHPLVLAFVMAAALTLAALGPPAAIAAGWEAQASPASSQVDAICAVSASGAWAMQSGSDPHLIQTSDGGQNWYGADNTGLGGEFEGMCFFDSLHGCVSEYNYTTHQAHVASTTDGGSSWTVADVSSAGTQISFGDADHGWMGGMEPFGKILHTIDGGVTWVAQAYEDPLLDSLYAVAAVNATTCWACTGHDVVRTTNSGTTWEYTEFTPPDGMYADALVATDADHAWAAGGADQGRFIMATSDGGATWQGQYWTDVGSAFEAIDVLKDDLHGWAVADDGLVYVTTDGGDTWQAQVSGVDTILLAVDFYDANSGWAAGTGGTLIHAADGGGPADITPPVTTASRASGCWVKAANANLGLTATDIGGVGPWRIFYSADGGAADWGQPGSCLVTLAPAFAGAHQILYWAQDKAGNLESTTLFKLYVDTAAPKPAGLAKATVRKGKKVSLKYKIVDPAPNGGHGNARIRVMTTKGKVLKTIYAKNKKVGVTLKAAYTCKLKKGTYKYAVNVSDQVGNHGAKVAYAKLVVK